MNRALIMAIWLATMGLGLAIGMVWGRSPGAVDWNRTRPVCIESDDWGLCGFLPDSSALSDLDRDALSPGNFPDVYWHSTLEDSAMVAALSGVLQRHLGWDGLPAVMQPNYILGSLEYRIEDTDSLPAATWTALDLPAVPTGYERPGLWRAVRDAQRAGVWHPELHGRWHYDPALRRQNTVPGPVARAAARQILVFPGSERAWELGPWRDSQTVVAEYQKSRAVFADLFGYPPRSIIAPDYVWEDAHEDLWCTSGLRVIQGQRQQRKATWRGLNGRVRKVLHRTWARWWHRDRTYLDRNCIFEPVQQEDPRGITLAALNGVRAAWTNHEPAVLEAHRINFAHLDTAVHQLGRRELDYLLRELTTSDPVFLVDGELAGLHRRGTCWGLRGSRIVVRNLTHSRRLVVVPATALAAVAQRRGQAPYDPDPLVLSLAAGETIILDPEEQASNRSRAEHPPDIQKN